MAFFTLIFVVDFLLHAAWVKDERNPISGGAGVELWPRKFCTVSFNLDEIKAVKGRVNAVSSCIFYDLSISLVFYWLYLSL